MIGVVVGSYGRKKRAGIAVSKMRRVKVVSWVVGFESDKVLKTGAIVI